MHLKVLWICKSSCDTGVCLPGGGVHTCESEEFAQQKTGYKFIAELWGETMHISSTGAELTQEVQHGVASPAFTEKSFPCMFLKKLLTELCTYLHLENSCVYFLLAGHTFPPFNMKPQGNNQHSLDLKRKRTNNIIICTLKMYFCGTSCTWLF